MSGPCERQPTNQGFAMTVSTKCLTLTFREWYLRLHAFTLCHLSKKPPIFKPTETEKLRTALDRFRPGRLDLEDYAQRAALHLLLVRAVRELERLSKKDA